MAKVFAQDQLEAIAGALGDTERGLTNPEIAFLIEAAKMVDPGPMTKRHRIYNAFAESQNTRQNRTHPRVHSPRDEARALLKRPSTVRADAGADQSGLGILWSGRRSDRQTHTG